MKKFSVVEIYLNFLLAFHNAMISNLTLHLNFSPLAFHNTNLKSTSIFNFPSLAIHYAIM